jgi:drug/metabolite transporter (DMT)-like permease
MRSFLVRVLWQRAGVLLSLTSLFWAGNIVLGRFIAGHVPPITLAYVRWLGAFLIILPFAWTGLKRDWSALKQSWVVLTILAFTGITAYNTMAYIGLTQTQALNALLIQSSGPLLIAAWTFVLFRERLSWVQAGGIVLSLCGVLVILTRADLSALRSLSLNTGDLWFFSALVLYGLYSALLRKKPKVPALSFLAATMGLGSVMLTPFFVMELLSGVSITLDAKGLGAIAYVVIFPSILAYLCFNRGVELVGPNRAAPYFHLMPVFGSVMAIFGLGERFAFYHVIGYTLVLLGIGVATYAKSHKL